MAATTTLVVAAADLALGRRRRRTDHGVDEAVKAQDEVGIRVRHASSTVAAVAALLVVGDETAPVPAVLAAETVNEDDQRHRPSDTEGRRVRSREEAEVAVEGTIEGGTRFKAQDPSRLKATLSQLTCPSHGVLATCSL